MKPKKENKFSLEKFEVAKLKKMNNIYGGDTAGPDTTTNTDDQSTARCVITPTQPPKKNQPGLLNPTTH